MVLLVLQCLDFEHPALHDSRTLAAALDEVVCPLLILRDFLLDCDIKLFRHLSALLGVVDDVDGVCSQRRIRAVQLAEGIHKVLEDVHALHIVPRHKIEMTVDVQLGRLQGADEIEADRLDLLAVSAALIQLKQIFGAFAIAERVDLAAVGEVVIAEKLAVLIVADIRQLFVAISLTLQRPGGALVVAAVDQIDLLLAVLLGNDALPDNASGAAKRSDAVH